jgi:ABC-type branched-subunit amino acid transport system ATPase component
VHEEEEEIEKPDEDDKDEEGEIVSDPALYDDLLKARQQFKSKRELFEQNIDKSLSLEDRDLIMSRYDDQMQKMERDLLKEQEDQQMALKAKLA